MTLQIKNFSCTLKPYFSYKEFREIINKFVLFDDILEYEFITRCLDADLLKKKDIVLFQDLSKIGTLPSGGNIGKKKYDNILVVKPINTESSNINYLILFFYNLKK